MVPPPEPGELFYKQFTSCTWTYTRKARTLSDFGDIAFMGIDKINKLGIMFIKYSTFGVVYGGAARPDRFVRGR